MTARKTPLKLALRATLAGVALLLSSAAAAPAEEIVFKLLTYAYDYEHNPDAPEVAQAVCGTRCNALSGSFEPYMQTGWRLILLPGVKTRVIDIDTPFLKGNCLCSGNEYAAQKFDPLQR